MLIVRRHQNMFRNVKRIVKSGHLHHHNDQGNIGLLTFQTLRL